ncbi:ribose-phosphate pyrophosphokinase [Mycolicibacterium sphagni]|uniref:ribose-phosphate diphosphokinase n=1 Tax=Mycolicibacterium sphagni TaxID=1786 RepID=A0A255DWT9_9MYCO|nr:ribose-phosphate pyrophosphokinase [Mycolicibacterium sphagni]OYN81725.1 hypothetical protein CG716_05055 [Mycolicibacterium sphagni]
MAVFLRTYTPSAGTWRNAAEVFKFPGGEVHLKNIIPEADEKTVYIADVRGADLDDLMAAALWADIAHDREMWFVLKLPYLPAARADKSDGTQPIAKYVYAKFIESMGADQIITIDTHSGFGNGTWYGAEHGLLDLSPLPLIDRALETQGHWRYDGIIAPDKGAVDRAGAVAKHYGLDLYVADKVRDFNSGILLDYKLTVPKSGKYLVVDDICDGGWTFTELADASGLDRAHLDLWVTHGIFSGKANLLTRYYGRIMTTDSHPGHNRVGVASSIVPTFTYMHETMVEGLKYV